MSADGLETIAQGDGSRIQEAGTIVARSQVEWRALWAAHAGPGAVHPPVDFGSRMVAAVFAGEQPSAGVGIAIAGSRREGQSLVLLIEHRPRAARDLVAHAIASPFHIVSLPRFEGEVRFVALNGARPAGSRGATADAVPPEDATPSTTGLSPPVAGALAYLAGPFSGAVLLATERSNRLVQFHAWQALIGLGTLGFVTVVSLTLAFALLVVSPAAFWTMLWTAAITAGLWVLLWAVSMVQAYRGRIWKWPLIGSVAARRAGISGSFRARGSV